MGFDFGRRRIGIAVGETLTGSARPLATLRVSAHGVPPWDELEALVATWRPARLVVGLPCHLDGREAPLAVAAREFAEQLGRRTNCRASLWNEALSTEAARASLATGRQSGARRTDRDRLNAEAAREILSGWLAEPEHG